MNEVKLKPCPFCGGEAGIIDIYGKYAVSCKECNAKAETAGTMDGAAKAWNKRNGHQTYREYFEEQFPRDAFPEADVESIIDTLCPEKLFGEMHNPPDCEGMRCGSCWDREMP